MNHLISAVYANIARIYDAPPDDSMIDARVQWAPSLPVTTIDFPVHRMVRDYADYRALFVVPAALKN
jgi:hypothetical protein